MPGAMMPRRPTGLSGTPASRKDEPGSGRRCAWPVAEGFHAQPFPFSLHGPAPPREQTVARGTLRERDFMSGTKSIPRETDRRRSGPRASVTFAALLAAAVASQARAARADYQSASYTFTQSNALADGVNYGTIQVESYQRSGKGLEVREFRT